MHKRQQSREILHPVNQLEASSCIGCLYGFHVAGSFPYAHLKNMKVSEIKKRFLKWNAPCAVGKEVVVPTYRRVSTTHDKKNSGYKQRWEPGKARVTETFCSRERGKVRFSIVVSRNACAVKWITCFRSDGFFVSEKFSKGSLVGVGGMKYASPNDDIFTPAWAKKLCERLNTIDEAKAKKAAQKSKAPKPTTKAKPCKCKVCKCGKAKARKAK